MFSVIGNEQNISSAFNTFETYSVSIMTLTQCDRHYHVMLAQTRTTRIASVKREVEK